MAEVEPVCTAKLTLVPQGGQGHPECMTQPPPAVISLKGNHFNIGRTLSSDAVVHSLQISRKHCVFEYKNSRWWIEDFSTNGIEINRKMLQKGVPGSLSNNDLIHFIPGGILSYRFDYTNNRPSRVMQEELTGELPTVPSPISPDHDEGSNAESESLLSVGICEDMMESPVNPGLDLNQNDVEILDSPDKAVGKEEKGSGHKRNSDVLGASSHKGSKRPNTRGAATTTCVTILDDEDEELLDLEDAPVVILSPQRKIIKTELQDGLRSPVRVAAVPSSSSSSPLKQDNSVEALDRDVLSKQLKYFTDKCRELANEKAMVVLTASVDKEELRRELDRVKSGALIEQTETFKKFAAVLDTELNCCVCDEIYIQPTVIDCGHTFCNYCIEEWRKKHSDCPLCRTRITNAAKQIELNNFVLKIHSLLPEERQERRAELLKERDTEVSVAAAVQLAEQEELDQAQLRGGRGSGAGPRARRTRPGTINTDPANNPVVPGLPPLRARRGGGGGTRGRGTPAATVAINRLPTPGIPVVAAAATGVPDLITLDDSQANVGGRGGAALPAPLIPTSAPPVTRARNNGGILNSIWQNFLGPNSGT